MQNNLSENNILGSDVFFTLDSEEIILASSKNTKENRLAFAVMLKFFQVEGRYPTPSDVIQQTMINSLAMQLDCCDMNLDNYDWHNRSSKRFRQEIRLLLDYRKANIEDSKKLIDWLIEHSLPQVPTLPQILEQAYQFCGNQRLEPFKPRQLDRYIATACSRFERKFFLDISKQLSIATIKLINELLPKSDEISDNEEQNKEDSEESRLAIITLSCLKKDIAGAKLKNVSNEIDKLKWLRRLSLPEKLNSVPRKLKKKYYTRICAELPSEIRKHQPQICYSTMAIFCHVRCELITDNLITTLIQLIHKMRTSAEISTNKDILSEVRCVNGKFDILYTLADTALA